MYLQYFGLNESPFSSTPDRRFVYLSDRHREGLAHLLYGLREQGGFVQLTGEVGTGKTTLCRYLLERVPGDVDVALVLNPMLTGPELLATICDELRVPYPAGTTSLKILGDALHRRLLDAHTRGRRTVVIVDEAQHLSPAVLEQMRLLTNLETATAKLLQIILIGQPELIDLLARTDLRQVAQRVAARFHLQPLSERETHAYVLYRIQVAGQPEKLFDDAALREVHRVTRGVPRLINIIGDRALLGAYAMRQHNVDAALVRQAAREVFGDVSEPATSPRPRRVAPLVAAALVAVVGAGLLVGAAVRRPSGRISSPANATNATSAGEVARAGSPPTPPVVTAATVSPAAPDVATSSPRSTSAPTERLASVLADPAVRADRESAFAALYDRWHVADPARAAALGCEAERLSGLRCLPKRGTWKVLRRLNLPAVLDLMAPNGARYFATVTALDVDQATLAVGGRTVTLPIGEVEGMWDGGFTIVWKAPRLGAVPIVVGTRGRAVAWLRERIAAFDGKPLGTGALDVYDEALLTRVIAFQQAQALVADGIVGEETLVRLAALRDESAPSLVAAGTRS